MPTPESLFEEVIDELVFMASSDDELADGIRWIDAQAQKKGITFYDMVFEVIHRHNTSARAQEWVRTRN